MSLAFDLHLAGLSLCLSHNCFLHVEKEAAFHMAACFLGAAGAGLGFGPSVRGSAGCSGTCASPGDTRGALVLVTAAPWPWGQILGMARGHCCGLKHTECCFYNLNLVMSVWNKRLFFSCLCVREQNLGCFCLHSCVKPPGPVGLDSSAALVFPT